MILSECLRVIDGERARGSHPSQLVGALQLHCACYFVHIIMAFRLQSRSLRN